MKTKGKKLLGQVVMPADIICYLDTHRKQIARVIGEEWIAGIIGGIEPATRAELWERIGLPAAHLDDPLDIEQCTHCDRPIAGSMIERTAPHAAPHCRKCAIDCAKRSTIRWLGKRVDDWPFASPHEFDAFVDDIRALAVRIVDSEQTQEASDRFGAEALAIVDKYRTRKECGHVPIDKDFVEGATKLEGNAFALVGEANRAAEGVANFIADTLGKLFGACDDDEKEADDEEKPRTTRKRSSVPRSLEAMIDEANRRKKE